MSANPLIVIVASATVVIASARAQDFVGPCPIGYMIEEVPELNNNSFDTMIAEDGTVLAAGRLYRSGVGVFDPLPGFRPQCINGIDLMAGNRIGELGTSISIATSGGIIATFEKPTDALHMYAWDISETGYVTGNIAFSDGPSIRYVPFRVTPDLQFELLDTPNGESAQGNAINASGQVCGPWERTGAFWDTDGTFHAIQSPIGLSEGEAIDINDNGDALILVLSSPPWIWSFEGTSAPLTSTGLDGGFAAWAMNHLGHVTGDLVVGNPWVWIDGQYSFLQPALVNGDDWELLLVRDINDLGQIVGVGRLNGDLSMFLLTPVGLCGSDVSTTGAPHGGLGYGIPDGDTTHADLSFFVNAWLGGEPDADITTTNAAEGDTAFGQPDGEITGADLMHYVNLWISECL